MRPQFVEGTGHPKVPVGFRESPSLVPGWIFFVRAIKSSAAMPECPVERLTIPLCKEGGAQCEVRKPSKVKGLGEQGKRECRVHPKERRV